MALGSKSTTTIRTAVDSILNEFCKYDQDKEKWYKNKLQLEEEINLYKKQLVDKEKEYNILLKRYKVLQTITARNNRKNNIDSIDNNNNNTKISKHSKSFKKNKQTFYATLPTSLSPSKIMNFIDDFYKKEEETDLKKEKEEEKADFKENEKEKEKANFKEKEKETETDTEKEKEREKETETDTETEKEVVKNVVLNVSQQTFRVNSNDSIFLRHHLDIIRCISLSDDDKTLISGSDDGTIKLWDLTKLQTRQISRNPIPITFRGHSLSVNCCCIMPNTNILITAGFDTNIYGWKLPLNGTVLMEMESLNSLKLFQMKKHTDIVWDISPNYSLPIISSISSDNTMKIYNIETQQLIYNYTINQNKYINGTSLLWNNSNLKKEKLCIATVSGHIILFDIEKNKKINTIIDTTHTKNNKNNYCINKIYCDNNLNSSLIYSACNDSRIRVFDVNSNKCIVSQKIHTDSITSMVFTGNNQIITASHDLRLRVWDFKNNKINKFSCIQDLEPQDTHTQKWDEGILCMTFNNSYKWLFSGGADGIKLYKTNL